MTKNEKSELLKKLINSPNTSSKSSDLTFPDTSVPSDKNLTQYLCLDSCPPPNIGLKEEKMQSRLLNDCPILNSCLDTEEAQPEKI